MIIQAFTWELCRNITVDQNGNSVTKVYVLGIKLKKDFDVKAIEYKDVPSHYSYTSKVYFSDNAKRLWCAGIIVGRGKNALKTARELLEPLAELMNVELREMNS